MQKNVLITDSDTFLDLGSNEAIGITFQANELGSLENRQGNVSNDFFLPFTATNRQFFENAENLNSTTLFPYRYHNLNYYEDNQLIIKNGVLTLLEIDNGYKVRLNSGNTDFFDLLTDKTVGDLFDSWHLLTLANIVASQDQSQDYVYPMIDFRYFEYTSLNGSLVETSVDVTRMRPCVTVAKVFEKMRDFYDWNIVGSFCDSDIFQRLVLTPDFFGMSGNVVYSFFSSINGSPNTIRGNIPEAPTGNSFTYTRFWDSAPLATVEITVGGVTSPANVSGTFKLVYDFEGQIKMTSNPALHYDRQKTLKVEIVDSFGTPLASETIASESVYALDWIKSAVGTLTYSANVTAGDQFYARIFYEIQEADNSGFNFGVRNFGTFNLTFEPDSQIGLNSVIYLKDIFNITQKDFLKDLMNMFCVIPQTNKITGTTRFDFFDDLKKNKPLAKDWSAKVDTRQSVMNFVFGKYTRKNWFRYKEIPVTEIAYQDLDTADWCLGIDNETLADNSDAVKLITSNTINVGDPLYVNIFGIDMGDNWNNPNNRFLVLENWNEVDAVLAGSQDLTPYSIFTDGISIVTGINSLFAFFKRPVMLSNGSLSFSDQFQREGLLTRYYKVLKGILNRSKVVNLLLKLNANDINELDYTIPIWLDVHQGKVIMTGYFYISQISQYKGGLTSVQLVRI